jgi:hypothetical protein
MGVLIELFFPPTSQSHGIPCQSIWGSRFEDSMSSVVPSTGTAISDYTIYVVPVFILNTMYSSTRYMVQTTNVQTTNILLLLFLVSVNTAQRVSEVGSRNKAFELALQDNQIYRNRVLYSIVVLPCVDHSCVLQAASGSNM